MTIQNDPVHQTLNLAERIRRLANGRTTLDVAQFQFIGLSDVRRRYGERWTERRDHVQQVARDFISRRLAPDDVLAPGADGFLVVFGGRTGAAADLAALEITDALNAFFVGTEDFDLRFESRRRAMSIDDLAAAFGDLIIEDADMTQAFVDEPHAPLQSSGPVFASHPVWDVRREALTAAMLTPVDPATRTPVAGYRFESQHECRGSRIDFDEMQLRASEDIIARLFRSGARAFVGVSLHVASLNSANNLLRLHAAMSRFDRKLVRYRIIRVAGIEPGFPRIYLEDIVRTLKSRVPHISLGLHWSEPDIASALRLQPGSIGFTLPPEAMGPLGPPRADIYARVQAAAEAARAAETPMFVDGDFSPEQALRFAAEGATLMSSPRIWAPSAAPSGVSKWPASRLSAMGATPSAA